MRAYWVRIWLAPPQAHAVEMQTAQGAPCPEPASHWLHVEICATGSGLRAGHPSGVGRHTIRERAEELGGFCSVANHEGGGAGVGAGLPISWESE
jgi:nitrate/nitrite-specific signal transduction histidine kinase